MNLHLVVWGAVGVVAALLPLAAAAGAHAAFQSKESGSRRTGWFLVLAAVLLAYFHPMLQGVLNEVYLEPKLERARELSGESLEQLIAELGEPSKIVPNPSPSPQDYGYALYGKAPWTPFARTALVVPLSEDGTRVSIIAHYAD